MPSCALEYMTRHKTYFCFPYNVIQFILEFTRIPLYVLRLRAAYDSVMAAMVVAGIVS